MSHKREQRVPVLRIVTGAAVFAIALLSCGGNSPGNPGATPSTQAAAICNCVPSAPASVDVRHAAKHVPLPDVAPQPLTVATMLTWPQSPIPASDAPRTGRELQLFQIQNAFVQLVWLVGSDCDINMEIADSADKSAPRAIVETPVDPEYCPNREQEVTQLATHGITLSNAQQELNPPLLATVVGLAFQDLPHSTRGTQFVQTIWELHPAVVTLH
jgi:hypothetical protein